MVKKRCCKWSKLTTALLYSSALLHLCFADCSVNTPIIMPENEPIGTVVAWIPTSSLKIERCRDDPKYDHQLKAMKVAEQNWTIVINQIFDAETMPDALTFDATCQSSDGSSLPLSLPVIISDVDEYAPTFTSAMFSVQVPENTTVGSKLFTFAIDGPATDKDRISQLTQYVLISDANGRFAINDQYQGIVELKQPLDYESGNTEFRLNVTVQEVNNVSMADFTTLVIKVTDVDDLNPVFNQQAYTLQLQEGTFTGLESFSPSPAITAYDGDRAINQTIVFALDTSTKALYGNLFDIARNGSLRVNGALKPGQYNINVKAYQIDNPTFRYAVAILVLNVSDVNNNKPVMNSAQYSASVSELAAIGTTILTIAASDLDEGDNAAFKFLMQGNTDGVFDLETQQTLGYIVLKKVLDREITQSYSFQVFAKETKTKELFESDRSAVTITVLDENDNSPVFTKSSYNFKINRTDTGFVGQVTATDADALHNGEVLYSLLQSSFSSAVTIDARTGRISLTRPLVFTDVGTYSIIAKATDNSTEEIKRRSSLAEVVIQVLPVNDHAPSFVGGPYVFNVLETAVAGTLVGQISAVDDDKDSINYAIRSGNENQDMRLDSSTGQLYLVKQYDLDTGAAAYLSLVVTASDGTHTTVMDVQIVFVFVNEFDPVFTSSPSANVQENSPSGTTITTVLATDRDKGQDGQITYSLVPLPDSTFFLIGATTGVITLNCNKCLDYATRSGYVLVVKAEDGGSPPRLSLQSLTINVTQTTFSEPRFKQQLYNFQVVENSVNYFQLDASDLDTPRSLLVFTNAAPNNPADSPFYANVFPNGTLRISSLDAEKISSMTFGASVTDGVTKDTAVIIVNVTDVNDNDPVPVLQSPISVFENAQSGQSVSVVSATDADISNAGFTFYIETGTDGKFEINSSTGLITTSGQFDRRLKSFYNFSVNVLDHGSPPRSASKFLVVNIVDSNTAPIFVKDLTSRQEVARYSFNISEDRPVGTKVGSLYAYDPDFGSSGQLKYSISFQEPINTFVLDSTDGQLTLNRILNYEIKNNYNLIVMVSDNSYEPKTATSTVNINVDNVVESPEWPLPLPVIYFTQATPCDPQVEALSQEVTTLSIHGDEGVEYKLLNHTDQFSINSTTGNLQVTTTSLSEGDYIVGLTACAKGSSVCSNASLTIKVSVSSGLTFCPAFVTLLVNESSRVNELLHDLSTNKGDTGVQYTITSGNAEGKFRINSTDGKLYINGLLDRETASQYVLTVSALRLSTKETANAQIIIYILDSPDTPPRFQLPVYLGEISESETVGTPVKLSESSTPLIVQATDEDLNTKLTYSIGPVNDTSLGSFSVNPDSGAITLAKSVDFDTMASSLNQMYSFLVLVSDGLFQASTQVHIKILDANDHSPVFTDLSDPILVTVMENEVISKNILSVVATDTDSIDSGKLEYSLTLVSPSGQGNPFKVDSTTGNIVLDHTLDREVVDEYLLNITVTDVAGHKTVKQVRITVGDVNDNGPYFVNTTYLMNVTEGPAGIGSSLTLEAVDKDDASNAEILYYILSGNEGKYFDIMKSENKGLLRTVKVFDREELIRQGVASLSVLVKAANLDNNWNYLSSSTCTVLVTVLDVNDNSPVFNANSYTGKVLESVTFNTLIPLTPSLTVTDADSGTNGKEGIVFTLKPSQDSSNFRVDRTTGLIYFNGTHLDRETKDLYILEIVATDELGQGLNATASLNITVLDVNDEIPEFNQTAYSLSVVEKSAVDTVVGQVFARDKDSGTTVYFVKSSFPFVITPLDGKILVAGNLDRKVLKTYWLNVSACDVTLPENVGCNFVNVTITVTDTNDHCPVWNTSSLYLTVTEQSQATTVIGQLLATDEDEDSYGRVTYFINDTASQTSFNVKPNGEVVLLQALENSGVFKIPVYAQDGGGNQSCIQRNVLEIQVTGKNRFSPVLCFNGTCGMSTVNITVLDNAKAGSVIGYLTSYDNDTLFNGETHYLLSDTSFISISNGGFITLQKDIAKNEVPKDLTLWVIDHGIVPRNSSTTLRIRLEASLTVRPVFSNNSYSFSAQENSAFSARVNVTQTDGKPIRLSLITENVPFGISSNGTLYNTSNLDREKQDKYEFIISATVTNKEDLFSWALVKVEVTDVNDNPPVFDDSEKTVTVPENTNQTLTQLHATDPDLGLNNKVTYILSDPNSFPEFRIDAGTGLLSLVVPLDRETVPSYTLHIVAQDGGTPMLSSTATVTVVVADLNDNAPIFTQSDYVFNINVFNTSSQTLYAVSATDKDEGINQKIVYKLDDTTEDSDYFYVDPLTGLLSSVQKLIRAHYYFKVKASDLGSPSMFTLANVTVNVQSNEIIPTLSVVPESVMLYVGMSQGYVLNVTLNATNTGVLQIAGGNEDQIFTLQNNKISLSHILSQPKDYLLVLEASNRPISQHTSTAKLQVSVRSVEFDQINYFANETENDKSLPRLICQLGSPAKQIAAVKYTLYNYNDQFKLDAGNGQLLVVQSLDRESLSVYVLNVSVGIVADGQSQGRRKREAQNSAVGYAKVIVQVGDENDNIPTFGSSLYFNLPASISDGALISQIQAFDPDEGINGLLQYKVTKGSSAAFSLDLQSGQFKVNNSTVLSTQQKWELQVSATDQNGAGHTAFTDVTIYVQNSSLYTLPASIPLSLFQSNQKEIIRSLGVLLGYTVVFNQAAKIKDSTTAISFSALDPVSNSTVSTDDIGKKVQASLSDISDLFNSYLKSAKSASNKDEGAYTTTSIVLIVIGCVMFVVSLFAILVAYLLWKKQKLYAQKEENAARVREKLGQQMTMTHKVSNASSDPDGHLEMDIDLDDSSLFSPDMFSNKTKELAIEY
ncbi:protocadherin Fat 4-like isoform X2 [Biomphalaria glabrata]|uniref:Protocadherin Fat 4-like isoform X2 n=1 Tax=Biomphalaria glabrata TaxID=6526 RepID=A0A9W2ZI20_BIOGL|nr:protocadherin Fat 4-like isoform X2 [Biomphalaria glabrata]